jgi:hypothetical protein
LYGTQITLSNLKFNKDLQQKNIKQKHLQQNINTRITTPPTQEKQQHKQQEVTHLQIK